MTLKRCGNPDCERLTAGKDECCCGHCAHAMKNGYLVQWHEGHTQRCDERHEHRAGKQAGDRAPEEQP